MKPQLRRFLTAVAFVAASLSLFAQGAKPYDPSIGAPKRGNARFYELHSQHLKRAKEPMQLLFIGDSITEGWGKAPAVWKANYEKYQAANFGIGGDRTEHILWRLANGNYDGLKPKLTVLMIGTNNTGHQGRPQAEHGGAVYSSSAEETAAGVTEIVKVLKEKQPQMKILLLAIFPRGATPEDKMRQQNEATNELIAKLDDGKTVFFMDINQDFLEADGTLSKEIMPDLLHPNEKGYEIWSKAIEARVKELMAE